MVCNSVLNNILINSHLRYILIGNRLLKLNKVRSVEMMWVNMNMAMIKFKMAQYIINELTIFFAKAESGGRKKKWAMKFRF